MRPHDADDLAAVSLPRRDDFYQEMVKGNSCLPAIHAFWSSHCLASCLRAIYAGDMPVDIIYRDAEIGDLARRGVVAGKDLPA